MTYEVHNPEIQATLRSIAAKVGSQLPDKRWGFLLMLYEFGTEGDPGSTFYISNGARADCIKMLEDWIQRQGADGVVNTIPKGGTETSRKMRQEWHKVAAILLQRLGVDRVDITEEDITRLAAIPDASVVFGHGDDPKVLQVRLVSGDEARRIAEAEEAKRRT